MASPCLGAGYLPLRLSQTRARGLAPSLSGPGAHVGPHLEWGVDGGVGQSSQLFFMSLAGNSIPIKFTPFGRIHKEQDGSGDRGIKRGGRQTDAGDVALAQGSGLTPPCFAPTLPVA